MLQQISHYRIEEQIGRGGMGVVFRAVDVRLNRAVALKFLPPEERTKPEARHRFLREARAASALSHNNIAVIHDIGESDDHSFIAMEYVPGETVRDRLKRGPLPPAEALDYAAQIADALAEAHDKLIVHRDIKSSNVVIKPTGQVKVLDFGLAKFQPPPGLSESQISTISTLTEVGTVAGTVAYMSPEQLRGHEVDARTDIFSLGVVLYEMLAGVRPFERDNHAERISATLHETPRPLGQFSPDVTQSIVRIVEHCLEKDLNLRYQSAVEVRQDLLNAKHELETKTVNPVAPRAARNLRPIGRLALRVAVIAVLVGGVVSLSTYPLLNWLRPAAAVNLSGLKRVAVLPARALTKGGEDGEVLATALTEALVTGLARTKQFTVLTARATERYRDSSKDERAIGQELRTDALLDATWQESGGQLKVILTLVSCLDGETLWRDEVMINERNLFAIQDRVLARLGHMAGVAESEFVAGVGHRPSSNDEAFRLYLRGKSHYNRSSRKDLDEAVNLYKQALEKDPNFALARAALALAYTQYINFAWETAPKWLDLADESADYALRLNDKLPDAVYARGYARHIRHLEFGIGDPDQARSEIEQALVLDPNFAPALYTISSMALQEFAISRDRPRPLLERALAYYQRANTIEPNMVVYERNAGLILAYLGRFDEAIALTERLKVMNPEYHQAHNDLALLYALKRDFARAAQEQERFLQLEPGDLFAHARLANYYAALGQTDQAFEHLRRAEAAQSNQPAVELNLASAYAGLNQRGPALQHFAAYAELMKSRKHYARTMQLRIEHDPNFDSLRQNPEFLRLMNQMAQ